MKNIFALILMLSSWASWAAQFAILNGAATTVTTSATQITAAGDIATKWLLIENKGTTSPICFGATGVTVATGTCLCPATATAPGCSAFFDVNIPVNPLYAISVSGSNSVMVQKGQ